MKHTFSFLLAFILLLSFAIPATAANSPEGTKTYKVSYTFGNMTKYFKSGELIKLNSDDIQVDDNIPRQFLRWEIVGNYEIISGTLTSKKLIIKPLGDITINEVFREIPVKEQKKDKGEINKSEISPKTGNNYPMALSIFILLSGIFTGLSYFVYKKT